MKKEEILTKGMYVKKYQGYGIPVFMKESLAEIWGEPLIQEFPKELRI